MDYQLPLFALYGSYLEMTATPNNTSLTYTEFQEKLFHQLLQEEHIKTKIEEIFYSYSYDEEEGNAAMKELDELFQ